MHEIRRQVLLTLPAPFGVDLSITNEVVLLWIAAAATGLLLIPACRRRRDGLPHGLYQNLFEGLIEFIQKEVVGGALGERGRGWAPFLLALFFFILFCNLLGTVPDPGRFKPATANINVTAGLAVMTFGVSLVVALRAKGLLGFARGFVPRGVPPWIALLVVPIEILSWLARPVSLAIRLFANMLAGHFLIFVFIALVMTSAWFLRWLPLAGAVAMSCFELFVCFIQAFIFSMLAAIYIREAMEEH